MAWFFPALKSIKPWIPSKYMHRYSLKQSVKYGPWTDIQSVDSRELTAAWYNFLVWSSPISFENKKVRMPHTHFRRAERWSFNRVFYLCRAEWTWNAHGDPYYKQLRANPVCAVGCSKRVPRLLQQLSCCYYDNRPTTTRRCPHIWKYTTNRTVHTLGSRVYTAYTATTIVQVWW